MDLSHVELMYILQYGYVALFAIIVASEITSFLPIGIVLVAMGAAAHQGYFNFFLLLAIAAIASSISDYIVFTIAHRLGKHEGYRRYVKNNRFASRIERYIERYPALTVFLSRLIGFASTPANAIAGLAQMPRMTFIAFDVLGNALCALVYLTIGYYLGAAWNYDGHIASIALGFLVAVVIAGYIGVYFLFRKKDQ